MKKIILVSFSILFLAASCNNNTASNNTGPNQGNPSSFLPPTTQIVSTIPANGDVNPYGVAFVPNDFPTGAKLNPGDILVSNFNNSKNLQGTGTTIVKVAPNGTQTLFFQGKAPLGLTTALAVLKSGFIIVGNLPTTDGKSSTAQPGSLLILDGNGKLLQTLTDPNLINGPWDMVVNDNGQNVQAFISNVLSGTVVRYDLTFSSSGLASQKGTVIASGYTHHPDPSALEVGPTGLVFDSQNNVLYVASTADNAIYKIQNAGSATSDGGVGTLVYKDTQHLHGPLGLAQAPNGDLLVTNSDVVNPDPNQSSEIVEFTTAGNFVKQAAVNANPGGSFGISVSKTQSGNAAILAAVDDNTANLILWTIPLQ